MKDKRVGILMGGLSTEREVSLASGQAIYRALEARGYQAIPIVVDGDADRVLRRTRPEVAFIALHGTYGEDGCVQGLLELLSIPYTGSGVAESALAMDKLRAKQLFGLAGVPTPPYYALQCQQAQSLPAMHAGFGFPVFVKPRRQGSSIGVGRADDLESLALRVESALRFDRSVLVERFVAGREVAVGLLDGRALGAIEIVAPGGVYDYRAKYQGGHSQYHFPARLDPTCYRRVLSIAERAAAALGVYGATRVDLLVTPGGQIYALEVNTLPGMTPTSLLPKIAAGKGHDFADLCEAILARARLHAPTAPVESSPLADAAE